MKPASSKIRLGFTIVEMLLVTVVIVLLVSVAGGYYTRTYERALVEKSARDFLLAAKYARMLAIERQSKCQLKLNIANNGFVLVLEGLDKETEEAQQLTVKDLYFKPVKFTKKVKFEEVRIRSTEPEEEEQNIITFLPNGTAAEAVVQIGDGDNHFTVCISAVTGKARIYAKSAQTVKSDSIDLDEEQG